MLIFSRKVCFQKVSLFSDNEPKNSALLSNSIDQLLVKSVLIMKNMIDNRTPIYIAAMLMLKVHLVIATWYLSIIEVHEKVFSADTIIQSMSSQS